MNQIFKNILILSDFDGTFTGKNGRIIKKNIKAIENLKNSGGHFTFSTGRLPSVMDKKFPDFRQLANAPLIMSNGALVYDPETGKILSDNCFDGVTGRKAAKDILAKFPGAEFVVYSDSMTLLSICDPDDVPGNKWYKMRFSFSSADEAVSCREYILKKYGDIYNSFRSWYYITEIVDKNAAKGQKISLLRNLLRERGFDDLLICCIGDFENDIDMLENADIAFCPDNAINEVKLRCPHILCNCDDGAVADMINYIKDNILNL